MSKMFYVALGVKDDKLVLIESGSDLGAAEDALVNARQDHDELYLMKCSGEMFMFRINPVIRPERIPFLEIRERILG